MPSKFLSAFARNQARIVRSLEIEHGSGETCKSVSLMPRVFYDGKLLRQGRFLGS